MIEGLSLELIVVTALADSINPCVFGVLIFLLAYMTRVFKSRKKMLFASMIYITSVYITYFVIGLGLFAAARTTGLSVPFYWFAAGIAILAGLFELKDFFWYGKGFSLQIIPGGAERIKKYTSYLGEMEKIHPVLSFFIPFLLGIFVVLVELPCTGAPYLAILGLISKGSLAEGIPLLLLYNLIFILPLFVIVGAVYFGQTSDALEEWRSKHKGLMRLTIGMFLISLGAYMIWAVI